MRRFIHDAGSNASRMAFVGQSARRFAGPTVPKRTPNFAGIVFVL
jgi:hypothetical protein